MRKLLFGCCLVAVAGLFFGCRKDEAAPLSTPSVPVHVFEFKNQKLDFPYFTHQDNNDRSEPTIDPPSDNAARFELTYFDLSEGEKTLIFNDLQLRTALQEAGMTPLDANRRASGPDTPTMPGWP